MVRAVPTAQVRAIAQDGRRSTESRSPQAPSGERRPLADVPREELADAILDRLAPKAS
jgi:hypothetical protein